MGCMFKSMVTRKSFKANSMLSPSPSGQLQIIKQKNGKSRGFAFITMASGDEARAVIEKFDSFEAELLKDYPFEIIDKPGIWLIKLIREFQGAKIKVCVYKYFDGDVDEEESEQDAAEGKNTDDDCKPRISLVATIDKDGTALKFLCNLYAEDFENLRVMMRRPFDSDKGFDYIILGLNLVM